VDATIKALAEHMEAGDVIVDGGNEWYKNSIRRATELSSKGILYVGMGVSGGETGARYGPSLMPGGPREAYSLLEPIITKIAAQVRERERETGHGHGHGSYPRVFIVNCFV
jgi:6-phosphogluconate dehydrogenase